MSSIARSYGFIAVLKTPLSEEEREAIRERFWEDKSNLGTTYDGQCVYYDFNTYGDENSIYFTQIGSLDSDFSKFENELNRYQLLIKPNTIKPFNCIYYNGCDFPIDTLTVEQVQNNYCDD